MNKTTYIDKVREKLKQKIHVNNRLLDLYTLLVLTLGTETTLEDVHDAWAIDKNFTFHDHKSIVPFKELSREVQDLDGKYVKAIWETALEIENE